MLDDSSSESDRLVMPRFPVRTIQVAMKSTRFRSSPDGLVLITCLSCSERLELSQPGEDAPERLLGLCPSCCDSCGAWHVINFSPGQSEAVIALLPSSDVFHAALAKAYAFPGPENGDSPVI
jgi:hypothetical protein